MPVGSWKRTLEERLRVSLAQGSECPRITIQTILRGPELGAPLGRGLRTFLGWRHGAPLGSGLRGHLRFGLGALIRTGLRASLESGFGTSLS